MIVWTNADNKQVIALVTDKKDEAVVIHSDDLMAAGTTLKISETPFASFIGSVTMNSEAN
jgi:hypothetical protein